MNTRTGNGHQFSAVKVNRRMDLPDNIH